MVNLQANAARYVNTAPKFQIDPRELAGRRVLVTGGTKGTGAAIVRRMAAAGALTITAARSDAPDDSARGWFVKADLGAAEGVATLVEAIRAKLGGLDIVIHNVGGSGSPGGGFAALSDALWQEELSRNLVAAVRLDRALLPSMLERGSGVVIHS